MRELWPINLLNNFNAADINSDGRITAAEALAFDPRFTLALFVQVTVGGSTEVTRDELDEYVNPEVTPPTGCNAAKAYVQEGIRDILADLLIFGASRAYVSWDGTLGTVADWPVRRSRLQSPIEAVRMALILTGWRAFYGQSDLLGQRERMLHPARGGAMARRRHQLRATRLVRRRVSHGLL